MANYNLREVLKQLGRNILSWVKSNCVNNCVSTTTTLPLAAAQGKVLQDQITTLNSNIETKLSIYNMSSINDVKQDGNHSIGWMSNSDCGCITFNISWISLQIKITSTACSYRIKYGKNSFTDWKSF